jgi:hypothetical protein
MQAGGTGSDASSMLENPAKLYVTHAIGLLGQGRAFAPEPHVFPPKPETL